MESGISAARICGPCCIMSPAKRSRAGRMVGWVWRVSEGLWGGLSGLVEEVHKVRRRSPARARSVRRRDLEGDMMCVGCVRSGT